MAMVVAMAFPATVLADTTGNYYDPPAAGSTGGMTVEILAVHVTAKVLVELEVGVTCQPKPASEYPVYSGWEDTSLAVWAKQASGRSIAFGMAERYFDGDAICDGTQHVFVMHASADPSGVPFKMGSAVVAASGRAGYYVENWETGEYGWASAGSSTGWIKVRLGK
jgi:hypothetical protein